MLYTDEDKLYGARHCYPYFKSDWDPVLFVNAAISAHLCAFDRGQALALGVWSDRRYEGCHDWDAVHALLAGRPSARACARGALRLAHPCRLDQRQYSV
ncbi:MAG: hypothetical protein WDO24_19145 [Pseudomonadota bacterium]